MGTKQIDICKKEHPTERIFHQHQSWNSTRLNVTRYLRKTLLLFRKLDTYQLNWTPALGDQARAQNEGHSDDDVESRIPNQSMDLMRTQYKKYRYQLDLSLKSNTRTKQ